MSAKVLALKGSVASGKGEGKRFLNLGWVKRQISNKLGINPYPGTFNLHVDEDKLDVMREYLRRSAVALVPPVRGGCGGLTLPALVEGRFRAFVVVPDLENYYRDVLELICALNLREKLHVEDGDQVHVKVGLKTRRGARNLQGLIIDMDGTLLDTFDPFYNAIAATLTEMGEDPPSVRDVREMLDVGRDLPHILRRKMGPKHLYRCIEGIKAKFDELKETMVKPLAYAPEALNLLRQHERVKIALATGSRAPRSTIKRDLERFGFDGYLDCITLGSEVSRSKPYPDLINKCLRKLKLDPSTCLVVGDATRDVIAGRRAGCLTAAVLTGVGSKRRLSLSKPDFLEENLYPLAERLILEQWM